MNSRCIKLAILAAVTINQLSTLAADSDLPAEAVVLDDNLMMFSWPYPAVSPDGEWIAYISRGYVCIVGLDGSKPREVMELPDTWTHFLARPENAYANGQWSELIRGKSREAYRDLVEKVTNTAFGLHWTHDSLGIVFGLQSQNEKKDGSITEVWHAPLDGQTELIARLEQSYSRQNRTGEGIQLTRDRRFLVWGAGSTGKPLIWDIASNRARATCFLYLTPSPTSGRWIGIEKDTRQLVVTDDQFQVVERHDDFLPTLSFGAQLHWSPDEQHVILRNTVGFDHYSNWEGYRLDLKTKQRRVLTGSYMKEFIKFTGKNGGFIRAGREGLQGGSSGLIETAAFLQIVPDGDAYPRQLWRIRALPGDTEVRMPGDVGLNVRCSSNFELFILGIPRQTGAYGYVWHLIDRQRNRLPLPGADTGKYESPYSVVGFADGDKKLVAYDEKRLFALPLSVVQQSERNAR
jgi:hypothetical protein